MGPSRRVAAVVVLAAVALAVVGGCSDPGSRERPQADAEAPRFGLYAPVLDGATPLASEVTRDLVRTTYGGLPQLVQLAAPTGDPCRALAPHRLADDTCTVRDDGVVVTSMEEMGGVGVERDGTLLYWSSLVTEADPGLVDRAVDALRTAPRVTLDELGDITAGTPRATPEAAPEGEPGPEGVRARSDPVRPADLRVAIAARTVRHLAGDIGPREATGPAHREAAAWVGEQLRGLGYEVRRQRVDVPAGTSWGVAVPTGRSVNVVAHRPGVDLARPHLVVGAHLDTVPQAPGAEDNASGVGVLLAVAEAVAQRRTRLPVVLVAFGAEEPRGDGDDLHHFGSRAYVGALRPRERRAVRGMVSLDRVGVGQVVPVGSASDGDPVQRALLAAARSAGVATLAVQDQRSSDHWSFVRAGLPGARLGSTSFAGYHSAGDVPAVMSRAQLARTGRVVLAWLAPQAG